MGGYPMGQQRREALLAVHSCQLLPCMSSDPEEPGLLIFLEEIFMGLS